MGISLRSVSGYRLLLHHANAWLHLGQVFVHRFRSEQRKDPSYCIVSDRGWLPYQCQHPSTMDGQENKCFQHIHCRNQLSERYLSAHIHGSL